MRPRSAAVWKPIFVLSILGLLAAAPGFAGSVAAPIPTLDGAGLASLAGGVGVAGAWLLARRRGRK